jgi:hypothetical protein
MGHLTEPRSQLFNVEVEELKAKAKPRDGGSAPYRARPRVKMRISGTRRREIPLLAALLPAAGRPAEAGWRNDGEMLGRDDHGLCWVPACGRQAERPRVLGWG